MSFAADAFQPFIVRDLIRLRHRDHLAHMMDIISQGTKSGFDLDIDEPSKSIKIDFRDSSKMGAAIGGDVNRFSVASFSSLDQIELSLNNKVTFAWGLIRIYYSAFYAGHALLRICGKSCSYLDNEHVKVIKKISGAMGLDIPFDVTSGLYACALNSNQSGLEMTLVRGRVGGAHEAFWEEFDRFISEASNQIIVGKLAPADAARVFAQLEALRRILGKGAGASWLSAVRNDIQYRQGRGTWVPSLLNGDRRAIAARLALQWKKDADEILVESTQIGDIGLFVSACSFIIAICREVIKRIAERYSVGPNSFTRDALVLCA